MTNLGLLLGALAAGVILGVAFFGGLWWTLTRALSARAPAVWFATSALVRMAVVVCGLYFFARLGLASLGACFCGLLIARSALKHFVHSVG